MKNNNKFNKQKFALILNNIIKSYGSQREFCKITQISRTHISEYMNQKREQPPKLGLLNRLAYYSNGYIQYEKLLEICGYVQEKESTDEIDPFKSTYNFRQYLKSQERKLSAKQYESLLQSSDYNISNLIENITGVGFFFDESLKNELLKKLSNVLKEQVKLYENILNIINKEIKRTHKKYGIDDTIGIIDENGKFINKLSDEILNEEKKK